MIERSGKHSDRNTERGNCFKVNRAAVYVTNLTVASGRWGWDSVGGGDGRYRGDVGGDGEREWQYGEGGGLIRGAASVATFGGEESSIVQSREVRDGPVEIGKGPIEIREGPVKIREGSIEIREGSVETGEGEGSIETGEGPVEVRKGPVETRKGPVETRRGDGERGDIASVEETGKHVGKRTGELAEDGSRVEFTIGGIVGWGKTKTKGEGGLSSNTGEAHVIGSVSESVDGSDNEKREERTELFEFFAVRTEGNVDVERTRANSAGVGSDGPNNAIERTTIASGLESLPLDCRSRVSGSIVKLDRESRRLTENSSVDTGEEELSSDRKDRKSRERQHREREKRSRG